MLVQFRVINTTMISKGTDYIVVEIALRRMLSYHIVSTFSPTLLLLLIGIITLFLDESHFEATIMLAITAMLVMYTLYQSASSALPKTAYLKMVDIWLIFGLVVPFIVFLILMALEIMRNDDPDKQDEEDESSEGYMKEPKPDAEKKSELTKVKQDLSCIESEKQIEVKNLRGRLFHILFEQWNISKRPKTRKRKSSLKLIAQISIPVSCLVFIALYMYYALTHYKS